MEPMKPMAPMKSVEPMKPMAPAQRWWPEGMDDPSSSGSQNDTRYAFFPAERRLLIEQGGKLTTYDSGNYEIRGVAQQQSSSSSLTFTSQDGLVDLEDLKQV